jgi:hypothetical protein
MTANNSALASDSDLQFDRVASPAPSVTCSKCNRTVTTYYYTVDDASVCSTCKRAIEAEWAKRKTGLLRAAVYGAGAAVAGAVIYYGVIAITNLEIGIVALLIGYMVGYAVRSGAGRGGRRFQVLAALLTYLSVGMAYSPLALKPLVTGGASALLGKSLQSGSRTGPAQRSTPAPASVGQTDSAGQVIVAPKPPVARRTARPRRRTVRFVATAAALLAVFVAILPIIAVLGSLPMGLISALIIGIGMRRAWRMTVDTGEGMAGGRVIAGPYRVGRAAAESA